MNRRLLAALIGIFAVGLLVGAVVGAAVSDSPSDASSEPLGPTEAECDAAGAVVDDATDRILEIDESGAARTADFFAALLAEQLAIVYAMDAHPTCFTLAERAGAAGLAGGLRLLGAAAGSGVSAVPAPTTSGESGE